MTERTIFLQALEHEGGSARTTFLDAACGDDADLRQRVEQLLHSHADAGSFLGQPLLADSATGPATPGNATETQAPGAAADEIVLDFLSPSEKPGSPGRLDHYEVENVVGRGGMGIVLRAFDEKLHRVVALKVMTRDIASSAAARKRFSREAKAAAAVVHDHIVPIHAIEESGTTPYLVMQYIQGQSLQQKIDAEGSLELKEILRIGMQIASGLAAAHKQGLVHRDIKPSNILLENGVQRVKITDFGLARAVDDSSLSQSGIVAGTPQYMSPEQADGQPIDYRSDLFSLGSVMYAMCTGRPPFRASSTVATLKRVCEDTPRPIRELNPDLPEWLADIIARLHAKRPADRFQSAAEVADALQSRLSEVQQSGYTPPPFVPARAAVESKPWEAPVLRWTLGLLSVGGLVQIVLLAGWLSGGKLLGWAAAACAVAMTTLLAFVLYQVFKHWRSKQIRSGLAPNHAPSNRNRIFGWATLIVLALVAAATWGNAGAKIARHFHRELTVRTPDLKTVVQFWETTDTDPDSPRRTRIGGWPMEPRATIANTREHRFRLAPARYWMVVTRDGKRIEERLLDIGWGGQEELTISNPAEADPLRDAAATLLELQNLVTLAERKNVVSRQQHQAGVVSASALVEAEIDLIEAKLKLARAQQKTATEMDRLYAEVVERREELLRQAQVRYAEGLIAQSEVHDAEKRLAEARLRLKEAPSSGTAGQGVLILKFESGAFSARMREFGAIVQLRDKDGKVAREIAVKPGSQVSTTVQPGEFALEVSDPTELELSAKKLTMAPDGEVTVTLRLKPAAGSGRP